MSPANKLLTGFLFVLLFAGMIWYTGFDGVSMVTANYQELTERVNEALVQAGRLDANQAERARTVTAYAVTGDPKYLREYAEAGRKIAEAGDWLRRHTDGSEAQALLAAIEQADARFAQAARPYLERTVSETGGMVLAVREPHFAFSSATADMAYYLKKRGQTISAAAERAAARARLINGPVITAVTLTGMAILFRVVRTIARPAGTATGHAGHRTAQETQRSWHHP